MEIGGALGRKQWEPRAYRIDARQQTLQREMEQKQWASLDLTEQGEVGCDGFGQIVRIDDWAAAMLAALAYQGVASIYVQRATIMLKKAGVPCERRNVDLAYKLDRFWACSPPIGTVDGWRRWRPRWPMVPGSQGNASAGVDAVFGLVFRYSAEKEARASIDFSDEVMRGQTARDISTAGT